MYGLGVSIRPLQVESPYIAHISNTIPHTFLVVWLKIHPHHPKRWTIHKKRRTVIPIPEVATSYNLLNRHVELRIMKDHVTCLHRILLWRKQGEVYVASPNDQERDIDHLSFDLTTTARKLAPVSTQIILRVFQVCKLFFLQIGSQVVPFECAY